MLNVSNTTLSNATSEYCKYDKPDSDLEYTAKHTARLFVVVFGLISNIFVIVLIVKCMVRRNLHYLIVNMAVSDALFLSSSLWLELCRLFEIIAFFPGGLWRDIVCHRLALQGLISYSPGHQHRTIQSNKTNISETTPIHP